MRRLIFVSVDIGESSGPETAGGAIRVAARHQAAEFAADDRARGPGVMACVAVAGTVADGLADEAMRREADLVVVGSSQRGIGMRVLLGDDTRDVLHQAPCAVAVAPRGFADRFPGAICAIGVGYGADAASERAVELARQLQPPDGSLRLTQAVFPSPSSVKLLPSGITVEAFERLAAIEGFDERSIAFGSVRHGLLELADRVDLLVIGLHRHSALGRLLHGSTADALLRELPCPLLAVPERSLVASAS